MGESLDPVSRLIAEQAFGAIVVPDTSLLLSCPQLDEWLFSRPTLVVIADVVHGELDNHKQRAEKNPKLAEAAGVVLKRLAEAAVIGSKSGRNLAGGVELKAGLWAILRPADKSPAAPSLNVKIPDHQVVNTAWAIRKTNRNTCCLLMSADQSQCVAASGAGVEFFLSHEPFTDVARSEMDQLLGMIELAPDKAPEPLLARLPMRESVVPFFIGRRAEMASLHTWLADPELPRWLLVGYGGKGKTSIAFEFADRIRKYNPTNDLDAVLWMTAKQRRLVGGKEVATAPDFTDLAEALECVLQGLGLEPTGDLAADKRAVLTALSAFPTLLVIDDVDSLATAEGGAVRAFFTEEIQRTKARTLFTSRRPLFGMEARQTQVRGFSQQDGEAYIYAKARELGIDEVRLADSTDKLLDVTDGSPLYIEDLLRLCHVMQVAEAIHQWERKGGETARSYALARELEELTQEDPIARKVIIACAMIGGPASAREVSVLVEREVAEVEAVLLHLRQFYLVPEPTIVEDVFLFDLNTNTRNLVLTHFSGHEDTARIGGALTSLGRREGRSRVEAQIEAACTQARLLTQSGRYQDGLDLLRDLDRKYPNRGEVWQVLGWVYKQHRPPKVIDATDAFARAEELGRTRTDLYWHWAQLEEQFGSAAAAIAVAERGLQKAGQSVSLYVRAASAHIVRAKGQLGTDAANDDLAKALELVRLGLGMQVQHFEAPGLKRVLGQLGAEGQRRLFEMRGETKREAEALRRRRDS